MDRRLFIHIQGGRQVSGVLRGYDMFLNLVVDQAYEELGGGERKPAGMVVSIYPLASGCDGSAQGELRGAVTEADTTGHPRKLCGLDGTSG